jgi:RimJ/RimL family protein N-acetyltransferase
MPGPVFVPGDRVDLHTVEETDLDFLQRYVNHPGVWRFLGRPDPVNREQERDFFETVVCEGEGVHLLVCAGDERVGMVGLNDPDHRAGRAELGYWIAPDHQEQGYGTEAARLLVGHGFDQLGLHRIEARAFAFNEASRRLLERLGFTEEGVHRDATFVDGTHRDTHWYGLLEGEWRGRE